MPRFAFYQEVRLARPATDNPMPAGSIGVILGIGEAPGQPANYGVTFEGEEHLLCCDEDELDATGRQFRREDFYDDTKAIRLRVDGDGRGHLA